MIKKLIILIILLGDFSKKSTIKQHLIIKHNNCTDQLTSSDLRKILTDDTIIIYINNDKKLLQIQEAICIKRKNK